MGITPGSLASRESAENLAEVDKGGYTPKPANIRGSSAADGSASAIFLTNPLDQPFVLQDPSVSSSNWISLS